MAVDYRNLSKHDFGDDEHSYLGPTATVDIDGRVVALTFEEDLVSDETVDLFRRLAQGWLDNMPAICAATQRHLQVLGPDHEVEAGELELYDITLGFEEGTEAPSGVFFNYQLEDELDSDLCLEFPIEQFQVDWTKPIIVEDDFD
ncbi:hypothetical protein DTL42_18620 [Bremerella cremea]|uniref:DUF2262 domain-containing protein n=1 Tax=Bremerella cremea TaxID=1031537 RepID=A0A368KMW4_9BACT|nr:hypothetical protein [Bremerella cremea]RCS43998.1 hypothetical protein DTL42_18620 [Bremerella cremea]